MSNSYAIGIDIYGKEHRYELNIYNNIWCIWKKLVSFIVYDNDNELCELILNGNFLEKIQIIGGKNIKGIYCIFNNLKELDLSMCEKLEYLWCDIELENGLILPKQELTEIIFV